MWITFLIDSFDFSLLNAISSLGPSIFFRFLVEIQVSVIPDFKSLKVCWYANVAKSLIGSLSHLLCSLWFRTSVGNVIVKSQDLWSYFVQIC